ncbi:MAG: hypothetical protein U9M97_02325 [Candidatus Hadarchaeota archaeon]|nr:hypothetical protein [Candidatus Hadarchaeota archaeon]
MEHIGGTPSDDFGTTLMWYTVGLGSREKPAMRVTGWRELTLS